MENNNTTATATDNKRLSFWARRHAHRHATMENGTDTMRKIIKRYNYLANTSKLRYKPFTARLSNEKVEVNVLGDKLLIAYAKGRKYAKTTEIIHHHPQGKIEVITESEYKERIGGDRLE